MRLRSRLNKQVKAQVKVKKKSRTSPLLRHSKLDQACPVLDTGESSLLRDARGLR